MPCTLDWESNGLLRTFTGVGELTGEDIFESNLVTHSDKRFAAIKYVINDFTKVKSHSVRFGHTEVLASTDKMVSNTKHELKIAIVVLEGPMQELALNYCELMRLEQFECEVFPTIEAARKWCSTNSSY